MISPFKDENRESSKKSRNYGSWVRSEYRHIRNTRTRELQAAKDVAGKCWWIYEFCKIPVFQYNKLSQKSHLKRR